MWTTPLRGPFVLSLFAWLHFSGADVRERDPRVIGVRLQHLEELLGGTVLTGRRLEGEQLDLRTFRSLCTILCFETFRFPSGVLCYQTLSLCFRVRANRLTEPAKVDPTDVTQGFYF